LRQQKTRSVRIPRPTSVGLRSLPCIFQWALSAAASPGPCRSWCGHRGGQSHHDQPQSVCDSLLHGQHMFRLHICSILFYIDPTKPPNFALDLNISCNSEGTYGFLNGPFWGQKHSSKPLNRSDIERNFMQETNLVRSDPNGSTSALL